MAWHQTGNKLLREPMLYQYTDVYMEEMSQYIYQIWNQYDLQVA